MHPVRAFLNAHILDARVVELLRHSIDIQLLGQANQR